MNKLTTLLGYLLLISGCGIEPVHQGFNANEKFPQKYAEDILSIPDAQPVWQDSFPSKKLHNDIRLLISGNYELDAAIARVEQAVAVHNIENASLFPLIDAGVDFDRSKISGTGSEDKHGTGSTVSFNGIMNWEPDIWGRLRARERASSLTVKEKEALLDQKMMDLQNLLVQTWAIFHTSKKLEQILTEQQETNLKFLNFTKAYFIQGQGSAVDILQQQGRLLAVEKALPEITSKKRRAANTYAVLMGRIPDGNDLIDDDLPALQKLSGISTPFELFMNRPDLKAGFLALQAADENLAASVAERLPGLSVGFSYGRSRQSFSSVETETILSLTGSLLAPLFDAGRLKAKMNQQKAEACESLAILEQAVLEAVREVEDAINLELTLFDKKRYLDMEISNARKTLDNAKLFYINGKEPYFTVLSSLVDLQNLQVEEIELQQELLINRCRLLRALGARWSNQYERF